MITINSRTMKLNNTDTTPFLTYNKLSEIDFIKHGFSTRLGGVSKGIFNSMNLALNRGDKIDNVMVNYNRLCESIGLDVNTLVASSQDHNTFVRTVTENEYGTGIIKEKDIQSVDALITNRPDVTLVTYYADCTPLFFVDTKKKAIGLAHAGWRGTVGRIGEKVVEEMKAQFGTDPKDLVCAIGPNIGKCCYEVDKSCADEFYKLSDLDTDKFIFPLGSSHDDTGNSDEDSQSAENEKFLIDLQMTNKEILIRSGVREENITLSDLCTKCNSDLLWSHRATKGERGTMCAMMCITS